ncbi:MAG: hypothetical protein UZ16_OP3001002603 [Candidatus Hinthialibacteria bacterium OLB16]|nr:MAG: hypothetical protein UZ16_OP3001002603 [Candidatus Hinthialibacteria bacterium OLB16]
MGSVSAWFESIGFIFIVELGFDPDQVGVFAKGDAPAAAAGAARPERPISSLTENTLAKSDRNFPLASANRPMNQQGVGQAAA